MQNFLDRVLDVLSGVVGNTDLHANRQLRPNLGNSCPNIANHLERVGRREHPYAHEGRGFAIKTDILVVGLSAEHDIGDLTQAYDRAFVLFDHELPKLLCRAQIGIRHQVY